MLILGSFFWPTTKGSTPPPPVPPVVTVKPSGGVPAREFRDNYYRRPDDAVRKERERLGIVPKAEEVIERIAQRQAEALSTDSQKQLEELERELEIQGIEWQSRYLELLGAKRQRLIDEEIGQRLRDLQLQEEETMIALLLTTL